MVHGKALGPGSIVANLAKTGLHHRMVELYGKETAGVVTAVAGERGRYVLGRHRHRVALISHDVATRAGLRRGFENALDVTGLATHLFVRSQERERGGCMVETPTRLGLGLVLVQQQEQGHQHQNQHAEMAIYTLEFVWIAHDDYLGNVWDSRTGLLAGKPLALELFPCSAVLRLRVLKDDVT